jgi:hypothetical protein
VIFDGLPGDSVELTSVVRDGQTFSLWFHDQPSRQVSSLIFPLTQSGERSFRMATTYNAVLADPDDGIRAGD